MSILLTGGAGFIGSHMAGFLLKKDIDFVIVDNLSNSDLRNINELKFFFQKDIKFLHADIRDEIKMHSIFDQFNIDSVIHFASLKSVNESIRQEKLYYENNVIGSKILIDISKKFNVKKFIFSSSACVYGEPEYLPINEKHNLNPINPYGHNKIDIESILLNDQYFNVECNTKILRYFNPIGAFYDGLIGEIPRGIPNNLFPYLLGVVNGLYPFLKIFGNDYNTHDGTPIRDYIHIMDLIEAHFCAFEDNVVGTSILNVGTGEGFSVLDIIKMFEKVNNLIVPIKFNSRREGDSESCYADNKKIIKELSWLPSRSLENMCKDAYIFSQGNKYFSP